LLTRRLTQSTSRKKLEPEVRQLRDHLAATRERPIEREASRWIGEADAITDDLVRIGHVAELLSNSQETGDSTADEHVGAARDLANTILECNIE
jgi:hypothetical protein